MLLFEYNRNKKGTWGMSKDFDLNEIRKRQRELVEMKKVQQGQIEAPQVDLEAEKIVPTTGKEKRQNFWYHYKWVTLGTVLVAALVVFFIVDMATKEKYDLTIMAFNQYQGFLLKEKQSETFEKYAVDIDQNGEVNVLLNSNQMISSTSSGQIVDPQLVQASSTKLFAGMQTFEGFIFILDEETYNSIVTDPKTGEKYNVFLDLSQYTAQNPAFQGDKLYLKDTGLLTTWGFAELGAKEMPDNLFLCLRDYSQYKTPKESIQKKYESEKVVFEKIIQAVLSGETKKDAEAAANASSQTASETASETASTASAK